MFIPSAAKHASVPIWPLHQVIKKKLAVCVPMLTCDDFFYEEGEGLEDDEVGVQMHDRSTSQMVRMSLHWFFK